MLKKPTSTARVHTQRAHCPAQDLTFLHRPSIKRHATRSIATSHLSQRPRHAKRCTSACAAKKVDIDSRQDGHLAPKTARSMPATRAKVHDKRMASEARHMPISANPRSTCVTGMTHTNLLLMAGCTHLPRRPRGRSTGRPLLGGLSASRSAPGRSRPSFEEVARLLRTVGQRP